MSFFFFFFFYISSCHNNFRSSVNLVLADGWGSATACCSISMTILCNDSADASPPFTDLFSKCCYSDQATAHNGDKQTGAVILRRETAGNGRRQLSGILSEVSESNRWQQDVSLYSTNHWCRMGSVSDVSNWSLIGQLALAFSPRWGVGCKPKRLLSFLRWPTCRFRNIQSVCVSCLRVPGTWASQLSIHNQMEQH